MDDSGALGIALRRARRGLGSATPLELSACAFVAALAQQVDRQRGIEAADGTPGTRAGVAAAVRRRFFDDPPG